VQALRAHATVEPFPLLPEVGAADAMCNQVSLPILLDEVDDLGLCQPHERVSDFERTAKNLIGELCHLTQG
jgi:hypothetical protein